MQLAAVLYVNLDTFESCYYESAGILGTDPLTCSQHCGTL